MHYYHLDNKQADQEFLSGKPVRCRAVQKNLSREEQVKSGDFILVLLSNGKKYKGKVLKFESFPIKDYEVGELVILRAG